MVLSVFLKTDCIQSGSEWFSWRQIIYIETGCMHVVSNCH